MRETKILQFPKRPQQKSPFEYAHNAGFFEFLDKNRDQRGYLDDYMAIRRQGLMEWHQTFPMAAQLGLEAKKDPDAVLLVDIGGGWGHDLQSFRKANRDTPGRLILQDLRVIIDRVDKERCSEDIETMEYDFFTPQPVKSWSPAIFMKLANIYQELGLITSTTYVMTGLTQKPLKYSRIRPARWRRVIRGS